MSVEPKSQRQPSHHPMTLMQKQICENQTQGLFGFSRSVDFSSSVSVSVEMIAGVPEFFGENRNKNKNKNKQLDLNLMDPISSSSSYHH